MYRVLLASTTFLSLLVPTVRASEIHNFDNYPGMLAYADCVDNLGVALAAKHLTVTEIHARATKSCEPFTSKVQKYGDVTAALDEEMMANWARHGARRVYGR